MPKKKGKWSKEARERQSKLMKERYGVDRTPLPSITREREWKAIKQEAQMEAQEALEMETETYISKRNFDYDTGMRFEAGQVVELRNLPNDVKLKSLGYVLPYKVNGDESTCIQCGKVFGATSGYQMHVASHYEKCGICDKDVAPEMLNKHLEAHAVLA